MHKSLARRRDGCVAKSRDVNLIVLHEALNRLAEIDLERSKVVELRFFAGLSLEETAEALGVSARAVKRSWRFAKAGCSGRLEKLDQVRSDMMPAYRAEPRVSG